VFKTKVVTISIDLKETEILRQALEILENCNDEVDEANANENIDGIYLDCNAYHYIDAIYEQVSDIINNSNGCE